MEDGRKSPRPTAESSANSTSASDPYLAQVPLTVSPFVSFPTATALPYSYRTLPSSLPPSATGETPDNPKPRYIVSPSGTAAHPDDVLASCHALQDHLTKLQADAEAALRLWRTDIAERELAEKRRVAPGWLDRNERILEPTRKAEAASTQQNLMDMPADNARPVIQRSLTQERAAEGEALDKAFGNMTMQ